MKSSLVIMRRILRRGGGGDLLMVSEPRSTPREADEGTRTPDPLLTMEVLYQLSYVGAVFRLIGR